jgi:hypothetical protein
LGDEVPESTAGPFIITRYANSTLRVDDPLTINRQTGDVTVANNLSVKNITSVEKQTAAQLVSQKGAILGSGNATFIPTLNVNNLTYIADHVMQVANSGFMVNGYNAYHDGTNWKNYIAGWGAQVTFNTADGSLSFNTTTASVAKDAVPAHAARLQVHPTGATTHGNHSTTGSVFASGNVNATGEMKVGYTAGVGTIRFATLGGDSNQSRYLHYDGSNFHFSGGIVVAPGYNAGGRIWAQTGDLQTNGWGGDPHQGLLFMNADRNRYIHYNGGRFTFVGGVVAGGEPVAGGDFATVNYVNGRTPFTPVQQGGGPFQGNNKIYIGWDGGGIRASVDGGDYGRFILEGQGVIGATWVHAGDINFNFSPVNVFNEPLGAHAVCISFQRTTGGLNATRHRYLQLNINGTYYTVGATN